MSRTFDHKLKDLFIKNGLTFQGVGRLQVVRVRQKSCSTIVWNFMAVLRLITMPLFAYERCRSCGGLAQCNTDNFHCCGASHWVWFIEWKWKLLFILCATALLACNWKWATSDCKFFSPASRLLHSREFWDAFVLFEQSTAVLKRDIAVAKHQPPILSESERARRELKSRQKEKFVYVAWNFPCGSS